jgi:hypothetical protein
MNDDWRVRVELNEEGAARELTERLRAFELAHDLKRAFGERVIVSRDGPVVFCYAGGREQADAAARAVLALAAEHGWSVELTCQRWHPVAEEWEDADRPLPQSEAERALEHAERTASERDESREQGYPEYEVRVTCRSPRDAKELAARLEQEGIPTVRRWRFILLGAPDEDTARALAERVRAEAPEGAEVVAEGSVPEVAAEAPLETPFGPFSVFGGLAG